jgi:hypothetical protein
MIGSLPPQLVRDGELAVEPAKVAHSRERGHLVDDGVGLGPRDRLADPWAVEPVHDHRRGGEGARPSIFSRVRVVATTECPAATSCGIRRRPTAPVPPVTNTRIFGSFRCFLFSPPETRDCGRL